MSELVKTEEERVVDAYYKGYRAGIAEASKNLGWLYFGEDPDPDYSKELLIVYYVDGRRHLGVCWRDFDTFKKEVLDEHPSYVLKAYRYLLEPKE